MVQPKIASTASLKRLDRWATNAVAVAREDNTDIAELESKAKSDIAVLRTILMKAKKGKLSCMGNMLHGMSGKLDEALMQYSPTEFSEVLQHIAGQHNPSRRSKPSQHNKMLKQLNDHLRRMSAMPEKSIYALMKVDLQDYSKEISNLLKSTTRLFKTYNQAGIGG